MTELGELVRMDIISAENLKTALELGDVLVLDCRTQSEFLKGHITGSLNINIPPLMQRRLKKGNLSIATVFSSTEMKDEFVANCKRKQIVVYDSSHGDENCNLDSNNSSLSSIFEKLKQEECMVTALEGGYDNFSKVYPSYIICSEQLESNRVTLGISELRIEEPCTPYLTEESTPSPSFPVKVINNLYLGNAKCSMDRKALHQNNIKYILNVTPNLPNYFEGSPDDDITYKQIPINDHWSQNLSLYFAESFAFIDEGRSKGCGVLVHCLAGISRSVTITVAYLMSREKMSLNDAYDYVKKIKPNISPNFNFMGQLLDFEQTLQKHDPTMISKHSCICTTPASCQCEATPKQLFFMTPTKSTPNFELEPVNVR